MTENSFNLWLDKPRIYSVVFIYITKAMTKTVAILWRFQRAGAGGSRYQDKDAWRSLPSRGPKAVPAALGCKNGQ